MQEQQNKGECRYIGFFTVHFIKKLIAKLSDSGLQEGLIIRGHFLIQGPRNCYDLKYYHFISYFYKKKENEVPEFHYILLSRGRKTVFSLIYFVSTKTYLKVLYLF